MEVINVDRSLKVFFICQHYNDVYVFSASGKKSEKGFSLELIFINFSADQIKPMFPLAKIFVDKEIPNHFEILIDHYIKSNYD